MSASLRNSAEYGFGEPIGFRKLTKEEIELADRMERKVMKRIGATMENRHRV